MPVRRPIAPGNVRLRNVCPLGDLEVTALRRVIAAGEVFECPAEIAGRVPGAWREPTDAERAEGMAGLVRRVQDGRLEVLDPGTGLLAQTENFVIAPAVETTEEK